MKRILVFGLIFMGLAAGCSSQAQERRPVPAAEQKAQPAEVGATGGATVTATPAPNAATGMRDEAAKEKDKRGNTPPGMDRTGAGPATGAIVDPAGVTAK